MTDKKPPMSDVDPQAMMITTLTRNNKQLVDANKMLLAFMAALLVQKHNGSATLNKTEIERNFYNYNVRWKPIVEGSDYFVLTAEPRTDQN